MAAKRWILSALCGAAMLCAMPAAAAPLSITGANEVQEAASKKPTVRVIVQVAPSESRSGVLSLRRDRASAAADIDRIETAKSRVISLATSLRALLVKSLPSTPFVVVEVDRSTLAALLKGGDVAAVQEDIPESPLLPQSGPKVHAPQAWALNARGGGTTVVILDTGVQADHSFLVGRVAAEACFSSTSPGEGSTTLCRNGKDRQEGAGAAAPCSFNACEHGTHVAGIASGRGAAYSGMAPDSGIVAVQVFSLFTDQGAVRHCAYAGQRSPCILSFPSDQVRGLAYARDNARARNIVAVNISIGGGPPTGPCLNDKRRLPIQELRELGVATAIASGNDDSHYGVSSPACIPEGVTVGATTDGDALWNPSNSSATVDLLAPGVGITSSVPANNFQAADGTSMAAPHVAGAIAALASLPERWTVDRIERALKLSGASIRDPSNGLTFPRIDISAAIECLRQPTASRPC